MDANAYISFQANGYELPSDDSDDKEEVEFIDETNYDPQNSTDNMWQFTPPKYDQPCIEEQSYKEYRDPKCNEQTDVTWKDTLAWTGEGFGKRGCPKEPFKIFDGSEKNFYW